MLTRAQLLRVTFAAWLLAGAIQVAISVLAVVEITRLPSLQSVQTPQLVTEQRTIELLVQIADSMTIIIIIIGLFALWWSQSAPD